MVHCCSVVESALWSSHTARDDPAVAYSGLERMLKKSQRIFTAAAVLPGISPASNGGCGKAPRVLTGDRTQKCGVAYCVCD